MAPPSASGGIPGCCSMESYFNYFTEIEEHFQKCRGTPSLLSPLDWALIESFQEAGVPLEIVLRGIDLAFEKHRQKKAAFRKINSLSYCTQSILAEHQRRQEDSVGKSKSFVGIESPDKTELDNLVQMMARARKMLEEAARDSKACGRDNLSVLFENASGSLRSIEQEILYTQSLDLERLEMRLNVMEEKILASLVGTMNEEELLTVREEINSELNRHRRGLKAEQLAMLEKKLTDRKIFERFKVPRLSLFYLALN